MLMMPSKQASWLALDSLPCYCCLPSLSSSVAEGQRHPQQGLQGKAPAEAHSKLQHIVKTGCLLQQG